MAVVRAAGGVVMREGPSGSEVLLVHRPRYDDWTLPKGKLDPGESHEAAAVREVAEETGLVCRLGPEVATTSYRDSRGRAKVVRYWLMWPPRKARLVRMPDAEVDAVEWLSAADAAGRLSYARDRAVVRLAFESKGPASG